MMQTEAYWENLVKRSLCRFLLLAELAKGPVHGYGLNQAIRLACQGCCKPLWCSGTREIGGALVPAVIKV